MALLLTYSGTGIFALAVGMLFPLGTKTIFRALLLGAAAAFAFYTLGDALNLSFTLDRLGEFDSERSSAYIRYIAPLRLIRDSFDAGSLSAWFGHGPGTIFSAKPGYEFHDPTWAKLLYEYGVCGALAFVTLFKLALARRDAPIEMRATLFCSWFLMGGHLLSPEHNYLTLALVTLLPLDLGEQAAPAEAVVSQPEWPAAPFLPEAS